MKKEKIKGFIGGIIIASMVTMGIQSFADTINMKFNDIKIFVSGNELKLKDATGNMLKPILYNGTNYLPLRAISEALGKEVNWDSKTGNVYIACDITGNTPTPTPTVTITPVTEAFTKCDTKLTLVKVDNELYNFKASSENAYVDKENNYYFPILLCSNLLSIAYRNYSVSSSDNQFLKGTLTNLPDYFTYENIQTSITQGYYKISFFNSDKTKKYPESGYFTSEQGKDNSLILYAGRSLINFTQLCKTFNIKFNMEIDTTNNLSIISFE